jgi:hypothetical protein
MPRLSYSEADFSQMQKRISAGGHQGYFARLLLKWASENNCRGRLKLGD